MKSWDTHAQAGWYVIQVTTGQESKMCKIITRACAVYDERLRRQDRIGPSGRPSAGNGADVEAGKLIGLKECFSPQYLARKKRMGEWHDVERMMLPGYVIAEVESPEALAQGLRALRYFCRVLANGETYVSLNEVERAWVSSQMKHSKDRVLPLSFGYKEGDKLVVTEGPLAGNEAMITKIDRKNCLAHIELHEGQITFKTSVGLVIMPSGKVRNRSTSS